MGKIVGVQVYDTCGEAEFDLLRPLPISICEVSLICFSLVSAESLMNVENKWVPESRAHAPKSEIVLVGTKLDLTVGTGGGVSPAIGVTHRST